MIKEFSLDAVPTFNAKVEIPVPGKKAQKIEFTFKHRDSEEFKKFVDNIGSYDDDTALVLDVASGWELQDAFGEENVGKLVKNYMGSARAIVDKYIEQNTGARLGNSGN